MRTVESESVSWRFRGDSEKGRWWVGYLADFEPVVYFVLEWPHLHFPDELWLHSRLLHDEWEELSELRLD